MCGPSAAELNLQASESQFMNTLQANYAQNFSNQQAVLSHLNSVLQPVVAAGPNQTGYSPQELAALNAQAIDTSSANYANEARALNTQLAGRNDEGNLPQSGVDQALKQRIASASANTLSNEELGITESDYATGRSNFNNAVSGEEALASQYNPVSTGNLANNANTNAFSEANTINQQSNQAEADIFGGITSLATSAIPGVASFFKGGGPGSPGVASLASQDTSNWQNAG